MSQQSLADHPPLVLDWTGPNLSVEQARDVFKSKPNIDERSRIKDGEYRVAFFDYPTETRLGSGKGATYEEALKMALKECGVL